MVRIQLKMQSNRVAKKKRLQTVNQRLAAIIEVPELQVENICGNENSKDESTILANEEETDSTSVAELAVDTGQVQAGNSGVSPLKPDLLFGTPDENDGVPEVKLVILQRDIACPDVSSVQDQDAYDQDAAAAEGPIVLNALDRQPERQPNRTALNQFFSGQEQIRNARAWNLLDNDLDEMKSFFFYIILLAFTIGTYALLRNKSSGATD